MSDIESSDIPEDFKIAETLHKIRLNPSSSNNYLFYYYYCLYLVFHELNTMWFVGIKDIKIILFQFYT